MKQLIKLYKEVENKINTYDQLKYFKRCLKKYIELSEWNQGVGQKEPDWG